MISSFVPVLDAAADAEHKHLHFFLSVVVGGLVGSSVTGGGFVTGGLTSVPGPSTKFPSWSAQAVASQVVPSTQTTTTFTQTTNLPLFFFLNVMDESPGLPLSSAFALLPAPNVQVNVDERMEQRGNVWIPIPYWPLQAVWELALKLTLFPLPPVRVNVTRAKHSQVLRI
jgi:hypothetical protein